MRLERYLFRSPAAGGGGTTISYHFEELLNTQDRFKERYKLVPTIDLALHRCSAVIDWIDVEITTDSPTQMRYVQDAVVSSGQKKPYVQQLNGDPASGTGSAWRIRLQDVKPEQLVTTLSALQRRFNCRTEAGQFRVAGIEVSVDFRQKTPSPEERMKLVGVLRRSIMPRTATGAGLGAHELPRTVGVSGRVNRILVPAEKTRLDPDHDKSSYVDDTFYLGERDGPWMIRIQDKWADQRVGEKLLELAANDRRARVEVTLNENGLKRLGVATVKDLFQVSITKLQGEFFTFFHPTFEPPMASPSTRNDAMQKWRMQREVDVFLNRGLIGLKLHRDQQVNERRCVAFRERTTMKALGSKGRAPRKPRRSTRSTDKAYDEINEMVRSALKDLGAKMKRVSGLVS